MLEESRPPAADWLLAPGTEVDQFQVLAPLGRGGMGEVYAATDRQLGRRVALKLIRTPVRPDGRSRALEEARTTARFSHPNIVTIYAVGSYQTHVYLALELLEGQTLRDRAKAGPMPVGEVVRIMVAVAGALEQAHAFGVQHRDLKPSNIFLADDGRPRILDFGVAGFSDAAADGVDLSDPRARKAAGTPLYMAPEQWRLDPLTPAVDVWAVGLILYEVVTGRAANVGSTVAGLRSWALSDAGPPRGAEISGGLDRLISDCLARRADDRPTSVQVHQRLRKLAERMAHEGSAVDAPFLGLMPFTEGDAGRFYGRDREVALFIDRLMRTSTVAVIGASGAGKTSFVQAGVIPRLRDDGPLQVISLRPGRDPIESLASQLLFASTTDTGGSPTLSLSGDAEDVSAREALPPDADPDLAAVLRAQPSALRQRMSALVPLGGRVLLFVDQLEEVVTQTERAEDQVAFMDSVSLLAAGELRGVLVVLTLREEFLTRVAALSDHRPPLDHIAVLRNPTAVELKKVLVEPVRRAGYAFDDPEVVDEMVRQVQGARTALPLLQFTAAKLWGARDEQRRQLLRERYDAMGGVFGALAQHADQVMEELGEAEAKTARAIWLRLVTSDRTRRTVSREALLEGLGPHAAGVLTRFLEARLIVGRRSDDGVDQELELVHESLISGWGRLSAWITQSSEELVILGELDRAADAWIRRDRRDAELWTGDALRDAERAVRRLGAEVSPRIRAFVESSRQREVRLVWRTRALVGAAFAAMTIAAIAFARGQIAAEAERVRAETQRAEAQLEAARLSYRQGNLHDARAKLRASIETRDSRRGRWLFRAMAKERLEWQRKISSYVYDVEMSPDGRWLAVSAGREAVILIDADTQTDRRTLLHTDRVSFMAISPDSRWLVCAVRSGGIRIWDVVGKGPGQTIAKKGAVPLHIAFQGPDVFDIAYADRLERWSASKARRLSVEPLGIRVTAMSLAPDGGRAWVSDNAVHVRAPNGSTSRFGIDAPVTAMSLPINSPWVAIGRQDGLTEVRSSDGKVVWQGRGHERPVTRVAVSREAKYVATVSVDGVVVWAVGRDAPVLSFDCPERAASASFDPSGSMVLIACRDGLVRATRLARGGHEAVVSGHYGESIGPSFHPDGDVIASGSSDQTARVWSVKTGRAVLVPLVHESSVWATAFSPDGRLLATAQQNGTVQLRDALSGRVLRTLSGHVDGVLTLRFDSRGRFLVSGSIDRTVRIWPLNSGEPRIIEAANVVWSVDVSPEGKVAIGALGSGPLVYTPDGQRLGARSERISPAAVRWLSETTLLYSTDRGIRQWNLRTQEVKALDATVDQYLMDVHRDSDRFAVGTSRHAVRIRSFASTASVAWTGHPWFTNFSEFDRGGRRLVSSGGDGSIRVTDADTGQPYWRLDAFVPSGPWIRNQDGWLSLTGEYVKTEDWARGRPSWVRSIETNGLYAVADSQTLCARGDDGTVYWWPSIDAVKSESWRVSVRPTRLLPMSDGCVVVAADAVLRLRRGGRSVTVYTGTADAPLNAVGVDGDQVWVASGERLVGERGASFTTMPGATAVARVGGWWVLGDASGRIEMIDDDGRRRDGFSLQERPLGRVERMTKGPTGELVVGYANGALRVWDMDRGALLMASQLNGPVSHLSADDERLVAATEMGAYGAWDLRAVTESRCAFLQRLWGDSPVVWRDGGLVRRAPQPVGDCVATSTATFVARP